MRIDLRRRAANGALPTLITVLAAPVPVYHGLHGLREGQGKMYKIENKDFGLLVTIEGEFEPAEAESWFSGMEQALQKVESPFGVLVDVREAKLFQQGAQVVLKRGMEACAKAGMERAAVALSGAVATLQARRMARETGISNWQRYLDGASDPAWRQKALGWIKDGRDPEI